MGEAGEDVVVGEAGGGVVVLAAVEEGGDRIKGVGVTPTQRGRGVMIKRWRGWAEEREARGR